MDGFATRRIGARDVPPGTRRRCPGTITLESVRPLAFASAAAPIP